MAAPSTTSDFLPGKSTDLEGRARDSQPRPRHNVKFSVQSPDADAPTSQYPPLPEIRLLEASEDIAVQSHLNVDDQWTRIKDTAALAAHKQASRHADKVKKRNSAPTSRRNSIDDIPASLAPYLGTPNLPASSKHKNVQSIALKPIEKQPEPKQQPDSEESDEDSVEQNKNEVQTATQAEETRREAKRLLRVFDASTHLGEPRQHNQRSGATTPLDEQNSCDYVPRPEEYKPSVLRQLLNLQLASTNTNPRSSASPPRVLENEQDQYVFSKLAAYEDPETDPRKQYPDFFQQRSRNPTSPGSHSGTQTPSESAGVSSSGRMTPRQKRPKWYKSPEGQWQQFPEGDFARQRPEAVAKLLEASFKTASAAATPTTSKQSRPTASRHSSANSVLDLVKHPVTSVRKMNSSSAVRKQAEQRREYEMGLLIDRLACQDYLADICRALMQYGAPTHRLEESLQMAARRLQIKASFQYLPGVMIVSFEDPDTHTTEVKLIKEATRVDLGKLLEVQHVYKDVMHSQYSVQEAIDDLSEIRLRRDRFSVYWLIPTYGLAAVSVSPWAFKGRPTDFPIAFILGSILGAVQLFCAARSQQFSYVSEVFSTFITAFLARGFGSILISTGAIEPQPLFCFSALAQSSIALILPGWIILSAALELQSKNILAGSIRMVYALFYTLLLTFGTIFGMMVFGFIYPEATNSNTCQRPAWWSPSGPLDAQNIYVCYIGVICFTICLAVVNQAKWKQIPWMVLISFVGYLANTFASIKFKYPPMANAISAFAIGLMAHSYSRFRHGVAAAAMLPAIFVLVPSGLASNGGLQAGFEVLSKVNNGNGTSSAAVYSSVIFNASSSMMQLAVGISVGLFLSALCMYPMGKKRSGIFSF